MQGGVVARLKVLAGLDIAERPLPQDGRFSATLDDAKMDLRVSTLPITFGEKVVLRLLDNPDLLTDLRGLGFFRKMLRSYEAVFRRPHGTILVTGPTGSGKSTTLYATLGELNATERNIVTARPRWSTGCAASTRSRSTPGSALRSIPGSGVSCALTRTW